MPTPVFLTGFEHGVVVTGATPIPNDRIWHTVDSTGGVPGIDTTTPRSGTRCLDLPATSGGLSYVGHNIAGLPAIGVASFAVMFVDSLPTADCQLFSFALTTGASTPNFRFVVADSTLRIRVTADGAPGFTVAPNTWYLVDVRIDVSGATRVAEATVNGVALGTSSAAVAATTITACRIGKNTITSVANGNIRFDDLVVSLTHADYPLLNHEVLKMSPNADGTHSFTANDFIRGDAGAAILTSDTDVWTLVDDSPFVNIDADTTDAVQQNVINAAGYVELALEAAPRVVDAWGVQFHSQYDADAALASTVTLTENDGGTLRDVHTLADISNVTETFLSECFTTAPTGGNYTQTKLDALKLRWGFSTDVTDSPIIHALMLEVAYPLSMALIIPVPGNQEARYRYGQVVPTTPNPTYSVQ